MMKITDRDFGFIQRLVLDKSAIVLDREKKYLVESRLGPLVRMEGLAAFEQLVEKMNCPGTERLARDVVEAMTTNETSFFRDIRPFGALRDDVLPALLRARSPGQGITIWCAACASGQEPYTVAMIIREHFPELLNWGVRILATDLSSRMLDRAKHGVYSQLEINRGLPAQLLVKYFDKDGVAWRARHELRSMVEFRTLNLAREWNDVPVADIVFLRNVLIYFNIATKRSIIARVRDVLCDDGYLFLGSAETTLRIDDRFERAPWRRAGCYRLKQQERRNDAVLTG